MAGSWIRLAHVKLASANATIDTANDSSFSGNDFGAYDKLHVEFYTQSDANDHYCTMRFNADNSSNRYSYQKNADFEVPDGNANVDAPHNDVYVHTRNSFNVMDIDNKAGKEKLALLRNIGCTTGKTNPPAYRQYASKWVETTNQITRISVHQGNGSNTFDVGSYITVFGHSDDVISDEKDSLNSVPANTRYEEVDTRRIYRRKDALTSSDADHSFDFGNDTSWSFSDSQLSISSNAFQVNKTNGVVDGSHATYDLGSSLSSTFIFRFKANFSTLGLPNNGSNYNLYIGVRSTTGHNTSANDDCSVSFDLQDQQDIKTIHGKIGDGDTYSGGDWGTNYPSSGSVSEDTDYYITYIRTSAGFTVQIRSGSHTGTLLYDDDKASSKSPTGLQYIWIGWSNRGQNTGADWVGTIDDFEIYDGVTSLDAQWVERNTV